MRPTHRVGAPGTLWVKHKGKGTYANDRPPILSLISRTSHEVRYWVLEHADKPTTRTSIEGNVPPQSTILYTDEASNYPGVHPQHASVCHSAKEWREMMMAMGCAKSIATVVKVPGAVCARTCDRSVASTNTT